MARKRTGQDRPGEGSPGQRKSRIRTPIVSPRDTSSKRLSDRGQAERTKALHVLSDLRRDPNLTPTQAAKNREISLDAIRKYIGPQLIQEGPGGRIRVTQSDRLQATLNIPSDKPDVLIPIHTSSSKERYLVGEWFASINEASRGDFTRLKQFPKGIVIDGVRLPTEPHEVQRILEAMETAEQPFEHLYALGRAV